jgi:hypothetical protein
VVSLVINGQLLEGVTEERGSSGDTILIFCLLAQRRVNLRYGKDCAGSGTRCPSSHNTTWKLPLEDFFLRRGLSGVPRFDGGMVFSLQGGSVDLFSGIPGIPGIGILELPPGINQR